MTSTDTQEQFQHRVQPWLMACFGAMIAGDREERNHRFIEEALELVQSLGCTAHEAHQLVDYVYGRDIGEPAQEVGGVMVTLAALCLANGLDMHANGETELSRIWTKVEAIRAKQAAKPKHSPLPMSTPPTPAAGEREAVARARALGQAAEHINRLEAALRGLLITVERLDISEGVCCCGDDMATHAEPMSCGHTPVDAGHYHHGNAIQQARDAIEHGAGK